MRKRIFGHMRTANAQISLRIRAVWSGPSMSANRIIGYHKMCEWKIQVRMVFCVCAGWSESVHFAHIRWYLFACRGPINNRRPEGDYLKLLIYQKKCPWINQPLEWSESNRSTRKLQLHMTSVKRKWAFDAICEKQNVEYASHHGLRCRMQNHYCTFDIT